MSSLFIWAAVRRRRSDLLQYICVLLSITANIVFAVIAANILCSFLEMLYSDWHAENIEYMERKVDVFFGDKSDMIYGIIYFLCIFIILLEVFFVLLLNRMWRKRIEGSVIIGRYMGYRQNRLSLMVMIEMFMDYLVAIPFVIIISEVLWKKVAANPLFSEIFVYIGSSRTVKWEVFILLYCIVLLITNIQNGLWLKRFK